MPAGRFVAPAGLLVDGAEIELPPELAHQVRDVLRLAAGETLTLLDGVGGEWSATVTAVSRARVRARLGTRRGSAAEPRTQVVLCQGMLKAAKFEWVLQKGTELGLSTFVPLLCERAVAGSEETGSAKRARWLRILAEATEQCGRTRLPALEEPRALAPVLATLPAGAIALIPWEEEHATPLRVALADALETPPTDSAAARAIYLFIGPEGGFSAREVALAREHGAIPVTLGPRILRAETAALVAATLVMEACGEMC